MISIATFQIHLTRFLDADGNLTEKLPSFADNMEHLISLYRTMTLTRCFDTKAIALQRTGKMGTYASSLGQEAVAVGIGAAMASNDVLCPAYREYGAQFQRGVALDEIYAYWGGDERGNYFKNNREDLPICVPIASQCLHAAGIAFAFNYRQQKRAVVCVCGDGATSQGDFYEALNVAGVEKLPVVFVINNNQWAISVPRSKQTSAETLAQKAIAAGIEGEQVDGNDVIAVQHVVDRALTKARRGEGATVIEALTYRLHDHTTADDASRYRDTVEMEKARREEPILRLRQYLIKQMAWSSQQEEQLKMECDSQVAEAVQRYVSLEPEPLTALFDYHYAHLPKSLISQRDEALLFSEEVNVHG